MHWIDGANNVPNKFGQGENGFSEGDPNTGVRGTILTGKWLDDVQRNIIEVIKAAGTGFSAGDPTDLYRALVHIIDTAASPQTIAPGTMLMFGGATAPSGWLLCNGAAVSRTGFGALFLAIGTVYGGGDGNTTFNLPDMRGRAAVGAGQGLGLSNRVLGVAGGEESHILTVNEMPSHTHNLRAKLRQIDGNGNDGDASVKTDQAFSTNYIDSTGGGQPHNNMPPYLPVNYIIKF
jgi:microcystin-dependent protein